jgi:hypothetical protein
VIGYLAGKSAWGAVAGASIGAVVFGVTALAPRAIGGVLLDIAAEGCAEGCLEGCFSFFVFVLASTVILGSLVLWQSLVPAALAGVGVLTVWLVAVSMTTSWYKSGSKTFDPLLV